jgi:taurine dioxygenase
MQPVAVGQLEPFGIEVDYDLREQGHEAELRELFAAQGLLVFRGQSMTMAEQVRALGAFGPVVQHWTMVNYVSNVRQDGYLGNAVVSYHSDAAYLERPALSISLLAQDVEDEGATSTLLASGVRACEALPGALRERARGLSALHLFAADGGALAGRARLEGYPDDAPRTVHPVIRVDPVTRREAVYVTQQNTDSIVGLAPEESEALLAELQSYVYDPGNVYEHPWHVGDFIIWSNQGVHHARGAMTGGARTLQRVCNADGPYEMYDQIPVLAERKGAAAARS